MRKALLFGALSALALPPFYLFPVLFVSVPGLLRLLAAAPTRRRALGLGLCFGFAHHLIGLYWVTEAILVRAATFWWLVPLAVPLLAAVLACFIAIPAMAAQGSRPAWSQALIFAGTWVLADLARQFIATGFPWNPWGSTLELPGWLGTALIQIACLAGVHGMTLSVLLIASLPRLGARARALGLAGCAAIVGFGAYRLQQKPPAAPPLRAVIAQGNIAETAKWSRDDALANFRTYLHLSAAGLGQAGSATPTVLIWPETASPFLLTDDPGATAAIAAVTGPRTPALIGAIRFAGQTPYNSLIALDPPPTIAAIYDKWHLVPFGEYQPRWLPGLQLVDQDGSLGFGSGPRTLRVPGLPPFAPLICYEAVFSGQVVNEADRPDWIVNITNDAWFGNSTGPRQHLAAARLRAVEEGLPLIRAANTGISAGFDAYGRPLATLGLGRAGTLILPVPGPLPATLFAQGGLWIPLLLSIAVTAAGILPFSRGKLRSRHNFV